MKIISLDRICPGKRHAWYRTNLGFEIRKPLGNYTSNMAEEYVLVKNFGSLKMSFEENLLPKESWFKRLIDWIRLSFFSEEK